MSGKPGELKILAVVYVVDVLSREFMHRFFVAQLLGLLVAAGFEYYHVVAWHSLAEFSLIQGACAALCSALLRGPRWWLPVHLVFLPGIVWLNSLQISPHWFLAGLVLLVLVYWSSFVTRVPLYLTNARTSHVLQQVLQEEHAARVADAGCGTGSLLSRLAGANASCDFEGWEVAPLPWLVAKFRTSYLPNCRVHRRNFWLQSWKNVDVLYVFLSPVPMPKVWIKALTDMRPGSLLISNSFGIPEVDAEREICVDDGRKTRLYLYRIPGKHA